MREYFTGFLLTAAVAAIASVLPAEGKTKKYVRFVLSLVILLVLLAPLPGIAGLSPPTVEGGDTGTDSRAADPVLTAAEEVLAREIRRVFALPKEAVSVMIEGEHAGGGFALRRILVTLSGEGASLRDAVSLWLSENTNAVCEVMVREK